VAALEINAHCGVTRQCRDGKRHQHRRRHQQHELVEQAAAKPRTISTAITTTGRRSKSAIGDSSLPLIAKERTL
jgi:hypothetical protein